VRSLAFLKDLMAMSPSSYLLGRQQMLQQTQDSLDPGMPKGLPINQTDQPPSLAETPRAREDLNKNCVIIVIVIKK
jgi:hypothetical protein